MGKLYFRVIGLITFVVLVLGLIGPFLISSTSTELVLGGFVLLFLVGVPVTYTLVVSIVKDSKKLLNNLSEEEKS